MGSLHDSYNNLVEIGRGGMATVYRATSKKTGNLVAIKVLEMHLVNDVSARARFQQEASFRLQHPNIVRVIEHDVDSRGSTPYIVMDYVAGESLEERIQREGVLQPQALLPIIVDIAQALDFAHSQGVVHRDVKPNNMLIQSNTGRAMLADFGIAKTTSFTAYTATMARVGSVMFMSPEQAAGAPNITPASDIYSLGVTTYYALSGRHPFEGSDQIAIARKHIDALPQHLSDLNPLVPRTLGDVVMRALNKLPERRPASASALVQQLHQALAAPPIAADNGVARTIEFPLGTHTPAGALPLPFGAAAQPNTHTNATKSVASVPPITPAQASSPPGAQPSAGGGSARAALRFPRIHLPLPAVLLLGLLLALLCALLGLLAGGGPWLGSGSTDGSSTQSQSAPSPAAAATGQAGVGAGTGTATVTSSAGVGSITGTATATVTATAGVAAAATAVATAGNNIIDFISTIDRPGSATVIVTVVPATSNAHTATPQASIIIVTPNVAITVNPYNSPTPPPPAPAPKPSRPPAGPYPTATQPVLVPPTIAPPTSPPAVPTHTPTPTPSTTTQTNTPTSTPTPTSEPTATQSPTPTPTETPAPSTATATPTPTFTIVP